ncbi:osmoprotectant transport system substrate-binding protein [Lentzea albidocapillata subsp. violacea]|uniref:Osmoprotectant transport system substrate-binding protein n=1 Tax=Lentzea albidocapillata subsp. violacea TaxID=128104 RepID=A0A1G8WZV4_9PSEU|nr:ABC transporter substrate-binding protein [Lentzea albidocapillata]SDJ83793.1 osmoprotectant transport system substrate-binding protein [Lentzea albidocapillata subsp. violacea]
MKRIATAVAAVMLLSACGGDPLTGGADNPAPTDTIVVGSGNFPESRLLAEIYAEALAAKGVKVSKKLNIGNRELYYKGVQDGSIDLIPEYTGVLLKYINKEAQEVGSDEVYAALKKALPQNLIVLDKSSAEDKDAVVVTKQIAAQYSLKSIDDLVPYCKDMVFGGPPEFQNRADGLPGLKAKYACEFKEFKSLDVGGPLTVAGLKDNTVQAADLFTTDAAIKANEFVVLEDPKNVFAAQNVVPLINEKKASQQVRDTLNAISKKLDTKILLELNQKLSAPDKPEPEKVAKEWLASAGI